MDAFDFNQIDLILNYEFRHLFSPERRGVLGDQLVYEGYFPSGPHTSLAPLVERFQDLGYDVTIFENRIHVTLLFRQEEKALVRADGWFKGYKIHIILLLFTLISTLWAGAMQYNIDVLEHPGKIWMGLPFAVPLLLILLAHEMGHYILSRNHHIHATLPYFIPFPNIIGTMGAIIKMKSPIPDREALIDVGMAGPLAGALIALPVTIIGLMLSKIVTTPSAAHVSNGIILGESLLFKLLSWLIYGPLPKNSQISLHPVAFAGWVGLLVTFMNLFPASQLDGGHISYALFGRKHKYIGLITCIAFALMGLFYWPWLIWMGIVLFIGLRHPPPLNDTDPISRKKRILGIICMVIFILTFIPRPFSTSEMPMDIFWLLRMLK